MGSWTSGPCTGYGIGIYLHFKSQRVRNYSQFMITIKITFIIIIIMPRLCPRFCPLANLRAFELQNVYTLYHYVYSS